MYKRVLIAAFWGISIGGMTFAVAPLSMRSENSLVAVLQAVLMVLIMPGLLGAAALARNAHAFGLASAATINALLQFGLCFLLIVVIKRSVSGRKTAGGP
jgi:hypothetical protein